MRICLLQNCTLLVLLKRRLYVVFVTDPFYIVGEFEQINILKALRIVVKTANNQQSNIQCNNYSKQASQIMN